MEDRVISFERILFPVDLSRQSRRAAPFVKAMAKRFHSEVTMLHVLDMPGASNSPPEAAAWAALINVEAIRQQRKAELESFLVDEFAGIPVTRQIGEGDAGSQIV